MAIRVHDHQTATISALAGGPATEWQGLARVGRQRRASGRLQAQVSGGK
jgi:hypothetical protein